MILLTGGSGFVGSAVREKLSDDVLSPTSSELDLMDSGMVEGVFASERPETVIHLAARVGGIKANLSQPARFLIENVQMDANVMAAAAKHTPEHIVFILSTCMYPDRLDDSKYPMNESQVEDGPPPPTNASYAAAKRTLLHGARALNAEFGIPYTALIPSNLYGPGDHFGSEASHFLGAAISRIESARLAGDGAVEFFGTGTALRQYLLVDDLASLIAIVINRDPSNDAMNVAPSHNLSIRRLAEVTAEAAGYAGDIRFSGEGPDGQYRKDVSTDLLTHTIPEWADLETPLAEGLERTIDWYRKHVATG